MSNLSAKPQTIKEINSSLVKNTLKKLGSATRAQLSEVSGISPTTVKSLLGELIKSKEVIRLGLDESSGGRRAGRYALNLDESLALTFYIRNNLIHYSISNPLRKVLEYKCIEISSFNYIQEIESIIAEIIKTNNNIKAIGIAVPGIVDIYKKKYLAGKKLNDWQTINIGEYIESKFNIPVILENDLNAIAFGYSLNLMELLHVSDLNILNMIYIHFTEAGTGAGIIANGELVRGSSKYAGELAFIPINKNQHLQALIDSNPDDISYIDAVCRVIASINCILNPGMVVIGGESFRFELIDKIKENCESYIPKEVLPDIYLSEDSVKDCFTGITEFTLKLMYSGVKLIK